MNNLDNTGASLLLDILTELGIEHIFGHTGGAVIPIYVEMNKRLRQGKPVPQCIMCRQEGGAGHAAEGYARATGKVGVVLVTSGPGSTNLATPIADAHKDSLPTLFITGQVSSIAIGSDAFQEVDTVGMTRPISKHNYLIKDVKDLSWILREAYALTTQGRPGPIVVDICKDVQLAKITTQNPPRIRHREPLNFDPAQADAILDALTKAQRPVIKAGGGVIHAQATEALIQFAERFAAPITTTFNALGALPFSLDKNLGMPGMHGSIPANYALRDADFILTLGGRFDDRVAVRGFADGKRIAHVDIDPSEIGKMIVTDLALVAGADEFLAYALNSGRTAQHEDWLAQIAEWKVHLPKSYEESDYIKPQAVIELLSELTNHDATVVTGVGQHQMWAAQYYRFQRPRQWISSGGLGTMGFGLPAAIGAWFANPKNPVILIDGDGSFQMNIQELGTVVAQRVPLKMFVLNNNFLGMVRQWQDMMDEGNHHETCLARTSECDPGCIKIDPDCRRQIPNLTGLKYVYPRLKTLRIKKPAELRSGLSAALAEPGPVLVDIWIDKSENVMPMVRPGQSLEQMIES